jgi:undecaprenyl-diphosphatase
MTILHAIIFGIVEGLTEFLPISSTAHLVLTADVLGIVQTEAVKTFEIVIQLGAILAVVLLRGKELLRDRRTMLLVLTAFLPTAVLGFLLHDLIKNVLLGSSSILLWSLFLGGIVLIIVDSRKQRSHAVTNLSSLSFGNAFLIGVFQSLALVPGVSRAGATIVGGELLGVERKTIVEFSFLLAIPTMAAATGYDLLKSIDQLTSGDMLTIAVGFVVSFVVAIFAIRAFLNYVKHHSLASFGIYRMVLAAVAWLFLA